jgi:hypothetical protein
LSGAEKEGERVRITRPARLVPCVVSLALLAGCADGNSDRSTAGFMDLKGVQAEYDGTVRDFPYALPPGVAFPTQVQQPTSANRRAVYEKGSGLDQAYQFWECAWQDHALRETEPAAVDQALTELERGLTSVYRTQYVIDSDGVWKSAIDKAKLGDLSALGEFYQSDCVWYRAEVDR